MTALDMMVFKVLLTTEIQLRLERMKWYHHGTRAPASSRHIQGLCIIELDAADLQRMTLHTDGRRSTVGRVKNWKDELEN